MDVTQTHVDFLEDIETSMIEFFRRRPEIVDRDVLWAIEELETQYRDELRGFSPKPARVQGPGLEIYGAVKCVCEEKLGRMSQPPEGRASRKAAQPCSLEEVKACLLRVRKSIQMWNKSGGQRGYLEASPVTLLLEAWEEDYDFFRHEVIRSQAPAKGAEALLRHLRSTLGEPGSQHAATRMGPWRSGTPSP